MPTLSSDRPAAAVLRGGVYLSAGQAGNQLFSFARSVIVARTVSPENFGIAAVFATMLSLLEMASNLSAGTLLVQAADGDSPDLQGTAQLLSALRGAANACLFLLFAGPASRLFGIPGAEWGFRCVAAVVFARGFVHLDTMRFQRRFRFGPAVSVELAANVFSTAAALPLALYFRSYAAMLWLMVIQAVITAVGSHLAAHRRYIWAWRRNYSIKLFTFGWPLMVNGLLMYGIMEGDRLVIGSAHRLFSWNGYTLSDLGIYSVAFSAAMAPALCISSAGASLFLPFLATVKDMKTHFTRRYYGSLQIMSLAAACVVIPLLYAGGSLIQAVYGRKYAAAGALVMWLAPMWGLRMLRTAPTSAAIARGDSKAPMFANAGRMVAIPAMIGVAASGGALAWIAACGFVGECVALGILLSRMHRCHGLVLGGHWKPLSLLIMGAAIAAAAAWGTAGAIPLGIAMITAIAMAALTSAALLFFIPQLRNGVRAVLLTGREQARLPSLEV